MPDRPSEQTSTSGDPILGRSVGNYRVDRLLGAGGMGSVYLLRHEKLPSTFAALKVLRVAEGTIASGAPTAEERFEQEAMVAAAIGSHRVVRPLDIGRFDDGTPYIVMEYVDGRSLAEEITRVGALGLGTALAIAARVADTMAAAHAQGIVHRDLKPSNLMLSRDGGRELGVRVLDFGVARVEGELKRAHTVEQALIGTPGYMSPEAAAAMRVDDRSDVFSLGVILFEMLTGEKPFDGETPKQLFASVLTQPAPAVASLRPKHLEPAPAAVEQWVARALDKEATARPSMRELHAGLVAVLAELGAPDAPSTQASLASPHPQPSPRAASSPQPVTPATDRTIAATGTASAMAPLSSARRRAWVGVAGAVAAGALALALVIAVEPSRAPHVDRPGGPSVQLPDIEALRRLGAAHVPHPPSPEVPAIHDEDNEPDFSDEELDEAVRCTEARCVIDRDVATAARALASRAQLHDAPSLVPAREGKKWIGYRLVGVAPRSLFGRLGLREGDVVTRVGGGALDGPDKLAPAWEVLRSSDVVEIAGRRGPQPFTLTWAVVDEVPPQ